MIFKFYQDYILPNMTAYMWNPTATGFPEFMSHRILRLVYGIILDFTCLYAHRVPVSQPDRLVTYLLDFTWL